MATLGHGIPAAKAAAGRTRTRGPADRKAAKSAPAAPASALHTVAELTDLVKEASQNTLAVNPLIGLRVADIGNAAKTLVGTAVRQPLRAARHLGAYAQEFWRVARGRSDVAVDLKDRRFADPAWQTSGLHKGLLKAYVAANKELNRFIDGSDLDTRNKERVRLVASIYLDAISPSNTLLNPSAIKRLVDTGGKSLVDGVRNLVHDIRYNNGLPSSVDKSGFELGRNLCTSPGAVVFKNEVLELIQYQNASDTVWKRPLIVCAPQVNKFYCIDLTPEKSLVRYAAEQGVQLFAVSWRNPTKEQRDWDMSTYVAALDEAVDAARQITGSDDVNLWGACSGGMTTASYLGHMAAVGERKVANVVTPVCVLDATAAMDTTMGLFATPQSLKAIKAAVKRRGFVDGAELARVFAWLRPNDLIWNYWVNNYLHGNKPPAFDVLFWNADTTRLPAAFHADLLTIMEDNPFKHPGTMRVLGQPIDMDQLDVEAYVVAGITDHITPWKACYQTAHVYGPKSTFVLANAGHLQSILNPPGAPKAYFMNGMVGSADPDEWAAGAQRIEGSWWPHWIEWMSTRSGERVARPKKLGSRKHKPGSAAPGDYIREA